MNPRHLVPLVAAVGLCASVLGARAAHATVVAASTIEQMSAGSDIVARIRVQDQRVVKDGGRIVTYTAVEVLDGIKGVATGASLEIFQVGGSLNGRSAWIVGAHRFTKGEDLVFFGVRHPRGINLYVPWGIGVGLFEVKEDVSGTAVVELIGDVALVERGADGATRPVTPSPRRFDSYVSFRAALVEMLAGRVVGEPLSPVKLAPVRRVPAPRAGAPAAPTEGVSVEPAVQQGGGR